MTVTPRPWVWLSLLLCAAAPVAGHEDETPHQLVMTTFTVEGDSLRVVLWVERPTPVVAKVFRERFVEDRRAASAQDDAFRQEQWATLAAGLDVLVDDEALGVDLAPLDLPTNGRGNDVRFVYGLGATLSIDGRDRLTVEYDNQALLGEPHVFLSVYAETDDAWRVIENSNDGVKGAKGPGPSSGATWSHDARLRQGRIVFARD